MSCLGMVAMVGKKGVVVRIVLQAALESHCESTQTSKSSPPPFNGGMQVVAAAAALYIRGYRLALRMLNSAGMVAEDETTSFGVLTGS